MRSARNLVAAACLGLACGGGDASDGRPCTGAECSPTDAGDGCPEGLALDREAGACIDVAPEDDCPPGSAPFLGSRTCQPVGWSCAAPYEKDPAGWGCRPTLASACGPGTLETFGATSCKPVGNCDAPFPPPGAAFIVDATLAAEDATHKRSVFDAVAAARPGDVVAIMPGEYVEDVDVASANVSIVGKCAAQVTLKNPGDRRAGILVDGVRGVRIRGLTLTGHMSGVLVKGGGEATLEDSLVTKNRYMGVYAAESGSRIRVARSRIDDVVPDADRFGWGAAAQLGAAVELEDVVVSAATGYGIVAANAGSSATVRRTVVRGTRLDVSGTFATGLGLSQGSSSDVDGLLVEEARGIGVMASAAKLTGAHLVVLHTTKSAGPGRGLQVSKGGSAVLAESYVATSDEANVLVLEPKSSATITKSVVAGDPSGDRTRAAHGVRIALGASLDIAASALVSNVEVGLAVQDPGTRATVDGVLVRDTLSLREGTSDQRGVGVGVAYGAVLHMKRSVVERNEYAGVLVSRTDDDALSTATITSTLVRRTRALGETGIGGRGVEVSRGAAATLDGCAITENREVSLLVGLDGASLAVRRSIVRDTEQNAEQTFGHGILGSAGASLVVDGSWLIGHPGVGLTAAGAAATVSGSLVARCAVGVHTQDGSELQVAPTVPDAPRPPDVVISDDTRFVDNATRVGSGQIPIPELFAPAARAKP